MRSSAVARSFRLVGSYGLACAAAVLSMLLVVSCDIDGGGGGGGSAQLEYPGSPDRAKPGFVASYDAGWRTGKHLFDLGGRGTVVREVVWGGCIRRSLTAGPRSVVDEDRGAWVLGCKSGAENDAPAPPAKPVTRWEQDPALKARFTHWVAGSGTETAARHLTRVALVRLGTRDYDIELSTTRMAKAEVALLADTFARWWDVDHTDGTAWNLIVYDANGKRLTTRSL